MEQTAGGKSKLRMKSSCRWQLLRNLTRGLEASRTAPPLRAVGAAMIAVGADDSDDNLLETSLSEMSDMGFPDPLI